MSSLDIEFRDVNQNTQDDLRQITTKIFGRALLAKKFRTLYILDKTGREATAARDNENYFVINIYAYPERTGVQDPPSKLWGKTFRHGRDTKWQAFEPSGDGLIIFDPTDGTVVAELVQNTLTILIPLYIENFRNKSDWLFVYEQILTEAHEHFGPALPSLQKIFEGSIPTNNQISNLETHDPGQATAKMLRQVSSAESLLNKIKAQVGPDNKEASDLAKILLGIPEVKDVSVTGRTLVVQTHNMYAAHATTKKIHEFGEFKVTLKFGTGAEANFKNLTRTVSHDGSQSGKYGHPHVQRAGGHWCTGEGAGIIRQLERFEFQAAVLFALKAISSVNDDPNGNYQKVLSLFPTVSTQPHYPEKTGELDGTSVNSLAKLLQDSTGAARVTTRSEYENAMKSVLTASRDVLTGTYINTLKRGQAELLASKLKAEINLLGQNTKIAKVSLSDDVVQVVTKPLVAKGDKSGKLYAVGHFIFTADFSTGEIKLKGNVQRKHDGRTYHAPHVTEEFGLPVSELLVTIPTLFGELEWDTAVTLLIEAIESCDETFAAAEVLRRFAPIS